MKTTRMPLPADKAAPEPSPPAPAVENKPHAPPAAAAPSTAGDANLPPLPPLGSPPPAPAPPRANGPPVSASSSYGPPPGALPPLPGAAPQHPSARSAPPRTVRLPLGQGPLPPLASSSMPPAPAPVVAPSAPAPGMLPPLPRTMDQPPAPAAPAAPAARPLATAPQQEAPAPARGQWRPTLKMGLRPPQENPLVEPLYWASIDLLTLASQFGMGNAPPPVHDLRHHLAGLFAAMEARARAAGVNPDDIRDAQFPIMALFDEILVQMPWPGQHEWRQRPLQLVYFQDNAAGETFFNGLPLLMRQPHRAHVLSVYFYCLALGFQGRYANSGARELDAIYDQVGTAIGAVLPPSETISPQAEPPDGGRHFLQREAPIVRIGVICFGVALLVFIILRVALSSQLSHAREPMDDYARSAGVGAP